MNLGALRSADYRRYFFGNLFALNGIWLNRVTVGWLAWDLTGQASFVGLVAFLAFAPTLVSGPFFGVLADRIPLRTAASITQSCLAAGLLALLLVVVAGVLSPVLLAAIALYIGIASSAHHPVRLALAPSLVPRDQIGSAVAIGSLNFNLARLTGPAIGGALIAAVGVPWALALSVLCFLPMLVLLPSLSPRITDRSDRPPLGLIAALSDGVRFTVRAPLIRMAMLIVGLFALVARGLLEILPVIADGAFARGPAGLGVLAAAAGAGALMAATLITLGNSQRPGRLPLSSRIAAPVGLALVAAVAWSPSWPLAVALVAGLGLCGTLTGVGLQSTVQLVLPDAYRARVMSLWTMVTVGGSALGAIILGALIDLVGSGPALSGAAAIALAIYALVVYPLARGSDLATPPATEPAPPSS